MGAIPQTRAAAARPAPSDAAGALYTTIAAGLTCGGILLSLRDGLAPWLAGQGLLALALLQWFVLMHECGHRTLFRTRGANRVIGHVAGVFSLIPYAAWTRVHRLHHHWTGWQDLDPTTASLVPRRLLPAERWLVNVCWRCWLPLFSVLYRVQNFWNLPRLARFLPRAADRRAIALEAALLAGAYVAAAAFVGAAEVARLAGLALFICLVMQDPLILSQHTHVPMQLAAGRRVRPVAAHAQPAFTRSIRLPRWLAALLLNFDAHELHHAHVSVPGHALRRLDLPASNEVPWWDWLKRAKRVPGEVFLFQNRSTSGLDL